jgi:HSP20 family molecular chaperone IbpA
MKPLLKTAAVTLASAVVGASITYGALKYSADSKFSFSSQPKTIDSFYEDIFKQQQNFFEDSWFANYFENQKTQEISKREDSQFIYYDIKLDDPLATTIDTKVQNGYITITGKTEKNTQSSENDGSYSQVYKSSFNQSFPLPDNVLPNKMKVIADGDKIILKFPKTDV